VDTALAAASIASAAVSPSKQLGRKPGSKTKKRVRLDVDEAFKSMDDHHFRRKYRMSRESYYILLDIIKEHLPPTGEKRAKPGSVPNGPITHSARLSMALRIAAGGDAIDIADYHGVGVDEPMTSFWSVVDAINATKQLDIVFPTDHAEQLKLAQEFQDKSDIDIPCCVGAIDGILIWIHKPSDDDCAAMGIGPTKFFCGRKKKFGVNMQAICDAKRRFLWVDIRFPGTTSDYFAFTQSDLFRKLEEDEMLLYPGLCLFGDNAYVNAPYMCVPFTNVHGSGNTQDAYNFFQSQLRINIECAFGMLVHRFGMLRKPFPVGVSIDKTNAALLALCKLHNYCIDCNNANDDADITSADLNDTGSIMLGGGMVLPRIDNNGVDYWVYDNEEDRLDALLDGGEHFEDVTRGFRRRYRRYDDLPSRAILNHVTESGARRPSRNLSRRRRSI